MFCERLWSTVVDTVLASQNKSGDDGMRKLALFLGVGIRKDSHFRCFRLLIRLPRSAGSKQTICFGVSARFTARYHLFSADKGEQMGFLSANALPASTFSIFTKKALKLKADWTTAKSESNEHAQLAAWACGFAGPGHAAVAARIQSAATTVTYGRRLRRLFLI